MDHLFVYGSLRQGAGHAMYAVLECHARLIGSGYVRGALYDINTYPGVVLGRQRHGSGYAGRGIVQGEVYRLLDPSLVLKRLDHYEQCSAHFPRPHEFIRTSTRVRLSDGQALNAWIYAYHHDTTGLRLIPDGDYLAYISSTQRGFYNRL